MPRVQNIGPSNPGRPAVGVDTGPAPQAEGFRQQLIGARLGVLNQQIDQQLAEIERMGQRLAAGGNLVDLHDYRNAVQSFFREVTAQAHRVRQETDWDSQTWEQRTMVVVEKVNRELDELAQLVQSKEQDRLGVLEKTGLILGMLLDIRI